jgi:hypothetical protein
MRETINTSSIIGKGCEGRIPIGVDEDVNIKMDLRDIWHETVDSCHVPQNGV